MLLAEELALVAIDPDSGRHVVGIRDRLNACLAGLLIAELVLDGSVTPGDRKGTVTVNGTHAPNSGLLAAALDIAAERGPKIRAVLSHMDRGLRHRLDAGTWDAVTGELETHGVIGPADGLLHRHELRDVAARDAIVDRLRLAAAGDDPLEPRTALVLTMTGPANLLEVVAPERRTRRHARDRIDHGLEDTHLQPIGETVRRVLADAAAAVAAAAATGAVVAASS